LATCILQACFFRFRLQVPLFRFRGREHMCSRDIHRWMHRQKRRKGLSFGSSTDLGTEHIFMANKRKLKHCLIEVHWLFDWFGHPGCDHSFRMSIDDSLQGQIVRERSQAPGFIVTLSLLGFSNFFGVI